MIRCSVPDSSSRSQVWSTSKSDGLQLLYTVLACTDELDLQYDENVLGIVLSVKNQLDRIQLAIEAKQRQNLCATIESG